MVLNREIFLFENEEKKIKMLSYINKHTHTHTHTHIYIYIRIK